MTDVQSVTQEVYGARVTRGTPRTLPPTAWPGRDPGVPLPRVHGIPVQAVLARYPLGELVTAERVSQGLLNRVLRLRTEQGEFVLKQYLDDAGHASGPALAAQHRTIAALRDHGVPTAPPVAAADGRTVVLVRGRRYALFPWVTGAPATRLDLGQSAELGDLVGRMHAALARLRGPVPGGTGAGSRSSGNGWGGGVSVPDRWPSVPVAQTLRQIAELRGLARAHEPHEPVDALAETHLELRRELLLRHAHRRPGPDAAPPAGWVHGDFHPLNLLYRDGSPAAVIDWDRLGVKPRAEEAVRAATQFFQDEATGVLDLARVRAYARAYRASSGTRPEEAAAAVHRVWWERLNDFWMLRWRYQRHDPRASELFPAAAAQIVWWCAEYQQVLDACTN